MFGKIKEALSLDRWIENFEGYLDARIELAKYDVKEAMVGFLTKAIVYLMLGIFAMLGLVCLNIGLGYWLGSLFGNNFAGFFILSAFYFLIFLLIFINKANSGLLDSIENSFRSALKQPKPEVKEERAGTIPENKTD